jgi:hypothetical protein
MSNKVAWKCSSCKATVTEMDIKHKGATVNENGKLVLCAICETNRNFWEGVPLRIKHYNAG